MSEMQEKKLPERIAKIAAFVPRHLQADARSNGIPEDECAYRWEHSMRVSRYGRVIAEAEGGDVELVVAACLLHDVASFAPGEPADHGRAGAAFIRPYLLEWGYTEEETEAICYALASHVDVQHPETLLARIVTDADNIDRFGAYRILLGFWKEIGNFGAIAKQAAERLPRLKSYRQEVVMETPTGQVLFNQQLDLQIAFLAALLKEQDLTALPQVSDADRD